MKYICLIKEIVIGFSNGSFFKGTVVLSDIKCTSDVYVSSVYEYRSLEDTSQYVVRCKTMQSPFSCSLEEMLQFCRIPHSNNYVFFRDNVIM